MLFAAHHLAPVLGIHLHTYVTPPKPDLTPAVGIVFDPMDYSAFFGGSVYVQGLMRGTAGTGTIVVCHFPCGGVFEPPLFAEGGPQFMDGQIFMGSDTVSADGNPFSNLGSLVLECNVVGMIPPGRFNKTEKPKPASPLLPVAIVLPLVTTVTIGGPPAILAALTSYAVGLLSDKIQDQLFSRFDDVFPMFDDLPYPEHVNDAIKDFAQDWLYEWVKPDDAITGAIESLWGDPVDIRNGSVVVRHIDFTLPGRLPFEWNRYYSSAKIDKQGVCGYGWFTPADISLQYIQQADVLLVRFPDYIAAFVKFPAEDGREHAITELINGALIYKSTLSGNRTCLTVETKTGHCYHFSYPEEQIKPEKRLLIDLYSDLHGNSWRFDRENGELTRIVESAYGDQPGREIIVISDKGRINELSLFDSVQSKVYHLNRYEYNSELQLTAEVDAMGAKRTFDYQHHSMVQHTNRIGHSFYYDYDDKMRVVHSRGDDGFYDYQFKYDDLLNEVEITNSLGQITTVKFSENRLPICKINPLGGVTILKYDEFGRIAESIDPEGGKTLYQWDERGNLLAEMMPDRYQRHNSYNAHNKAESHSDNLGKLWQTCWNDQGKPVEEIDPLGNCTYFAYDEYGQLVSSTNAFGGQLTLTYDRFGMLKTHTNALGAQCYYLHDALGSLLCFTDEIKQKTSYHYDAKGRLILQKNADETQTRIEYDANDNPVCYQDAQGGNTRLIYNGVNEVIQYVTPDKHTITYQYDTEEQIVAVVNNQLQEYKLVYDALGQIVEEQNYWGQSTHYQYDKIGRLMQKTDPLGRVIQYKTDKIGNIIEKSFVSELDPCENILEQYAYNKRGQLTEFSNGWRVVQRQFDALGQLTAEYQDGFAIYYGYDRLGNLTQRKTDAGHQVDYVYDATNRLVHLSLNNDKPISFYYDDAGQLIQESLNAGLSREYHYDAQMRLIGQELLDRELPIFATRYQYDAVDKLTVRLDSYRGREDFHYDPVGRLLSHSQQSKKIADFVYSKAGNMLLLEQHESNDERSAFNWWLEGIYGDQNYYFDRTGNLRQRQNAKDKGKNTQYFYNANNQLIHSQQGNEITSYGYDALGRRVFKQNMTDTTWFYWDGDALLGEVTKNNQQAMLSTSSSTTSPTTSPTTALLKADDYSKVSERQSARKELLEFIQEYVYYPQTFQPLALLTQKDAVQQCYYYFCDPNGCPTRLTDKSGKMVWSATYNAWGDIRQLDVEKVYNPLRFQGQYYDNETDLHYNRHRYYNPETGSYISQDPIGLAGGVNNYAYAPNPLVWADPLGLNNDTTSTTSASDPTSNVPSNKKSNANAPRDPNQPSRECQMSRPNKPCRVGDTGKSGRTKTKTGKKGSSGSW